MPVSPADRPSQADYAMAVTGILRGYFPDLDPDTARHLRQWIERQASDPHTAGEFIVDNPRSARWRLTPVRCGPGRVHLGYYPVIPPGSPSFTRLQEVVNDALASIGPRRDDRLLSP